MSSDNGDKRFSSSTGIFLEQEEQETSPRCRNTNFSCPRTEFLKGFSLCEFPCYLKKILGKMVPLISIKIFFIFLLTSIYLTVASLKDGYTLFIAFNLNTISENYSQTEICIKNMGCNNVSRFVENYRNCHQYKLDWGTGSM